MTITLNNSYLFHSYVLEWIFIFVYVFLINFLNYLALVSLCFKKVDNSKNNSKTNSNIGKRSSDSSDGNDDNWWKIFIKGFLIFVAGSLVTLATLWLIGFDFDSASKVDQKVLEEVALQKKFIEYYMNFAQYDLNVNHIEDNSELYDTLIANGIISRGELAVLTYRAEEWRALLDGMTNKNFLSYVDTLDIWSTDQSIKEDLDKIDRLVIAIDIELANVSGDVSEASE